MGSGKTTVGSHLARLLGWHFVDLDAAIVQHERRSIADIFRSDGENRFRQIERATLERVLAGEAPAVIALGGGTFIPPANRERLRGCNARTVYLDGDFDVLFARCGAEQGTRPLLRSAEQFRKLHTERDPVYRTSELTVSTGEKSPEAIAAEIAKAVAAWIETPAVSE